MAAFEREQQEIRHGLKEEIATCKAQLQIAESKDDLGSVVDRMNVLHHEAMGAIASAQKDAVTGVGDAITEMARQMQQHQRQLLEGQREQKELLADIREALTRRPEGAS